MFRRPDRFDRLRTIIAGLEAELAGISALDDSLHAFSLALLDYAQSVFPERAAVIEQITNKYDELIEIDPQRNAAVLRTIDDLRDILERKTVVDRCEAQFDEYQKDLERDKRALAKARGKPDEPLARAHATASLDLARAAGRALVAQNERFARFVANRLAHAFAAYGEGLIGPSDQQAATLDALIVELSAKL
jgi:hypothetical protein